jgi:3-hydroxyisobutyrate dehydrogenase
MEIGFVGLDALGGVLARRLMTSRRLHVFDARNETMHQFELEGATLARDLPSLARACDLILIWAPDSNTVHEVIFGDRGLVSGLSHGKIIVDQTTGDPVQTRRMSAKLAKLGVQIVDAPVSLRTEDGTDTFSVLCGGPHDTIEKLRPILDEISSDRLYCGDVGNGQVAMLLDIAAAACNRMITYEAATMGYKYGLSLTDIANIINKSTGRSGMSERILPFLVSGGGETTSCEIGPFVRDLEIATKMGVSCGAPMLIANMARGILQSIMHEIGPAAKLDEMTGSIERMAATKFANLAS